MAWGSNPFTSYSQMPYGGTTTWGGGGWNPQSQNTGNFNQGALNFGGGSSMGGSMGNMSGWGDPAGDPYSVFGGGGSFIPPESPWAQQAPRGPNSMGNLGGSLGNVSNGPPNWLGGGSMGGQQMNGYPGWMGSMNGGMGGGMPPWMQGQMGGQSPWGMGGIGGQYGGFPGMYGRPGNIGGQQQQPNGNPAARSGQFGPNDNPAARGNPGNNFGLPTQVQSTQPGGVPAANGTAFSQQELQTGQFAPPSTPTYIQGPTASMFGAPQQPPGTTRYNLSAGRWE